MSIFTRRSKANLHPDHKKPESPFHVPAELREDYANVDVTMAKVARHLEAAMHQRADLAQEEADEKAARPSTPGGVRFTDGAARKAVLTQGLMDEDTEVAAHLAALAEATGVKAVRDAETERQRLREEARCRCCGVLDQHTAPVVIELSEHTPGKAQRYGKPHLVKVPGGRVCGWCDAVIRHQWVDKLATTATTGGGTYGDHARAFLRT